MPPVADVPETSHGIIGPSVALSPPRNHPRHYRPFPITRPSPKNSSDDVDDDDDDDDATELLVEPKKYPVTPVRSKHAVQLRLAALKQDIDNNNTTSKKSLEQRAQFDEDVLASIRRARRLRRCNETRTTIAPLACKALERRRNALRELRAWKKEQTPLSTPPRQRQYKGCQDWSQALLDIIICGGAGGGVCSTRNDDDDDEQRQEAVSEQVQDDLRTLGQELRQLRRMSTLPRQYSDEEDSILHYPPPPPPGQKRVHFGIPLVTKIQHRPMTELEDVARLYFLPDELELYEHDRISTPSEQYECQLVHNAAAVQVAYRSYDYLVVALTE